MTLKQVRRNLGLSQKAIAAKAGITLYSIQKMEKGDYAHATVVDLAKLLILYGMKYSDVRDSDHEIIGYIDPTVRAVQRWRNRTISQQVGITELNHSGGEIK